MAKGAGFERKIAKELSLWWTGGKRDDIFWRTSQSGGRATVRRQKGKATANQDGDLCATDPAGLPLTNKVTIELKVGYNKWTIKELIDSHHKAKTILEKFIEQSQREAENQKREYWWLIVKQDRREVLLFTNHAFLKWLIKKIDSRVLLMPFVSISHPVYGVVHAVALKKFFDVVKPEVFL